MAVKRGRRAQKPWQQAKRSRSRQGAKSAPGPKRVGAAERAQEAQPLDESRIGNAPQLGSIDALSFDRAVMMCHRGRGREGAVNLARWICTGLKALAPEDRRGIAYIQIDEPLGDDLKPFQGNLFFPPGPIVACMTGTRALVNDICIGGLKASGRGAMGGGRFAHRLNTLPVWTIVQDDNVLVTNEAYFAGMQQGLREAGWKVWTLEFNIFGLGWGAAAEQILAALPETVPDRKSAPVPK